MSELGDFAVLIFFVQMSEHVRYRFFINDAELDMSHTGSDLHGPIR